jgi:hypothetical protein
MAGARSGTLEPCSWSPSTTSGRRPN